MRYLLDVTMTNRLLRVLIREVIEASASSSASPETQPSTPPDQQNDGGDETTKMPEKAVEDYISNTKGAVEAKREDEEQKLADTLKKNGVDTPDKVMDTLRNLERAEDGGQSFADEIIKRQTTAEGRKFGKGRR